MPASCSASMPAAMASCVSRPSACTRSSSTPNSAPRSKAPARPASLITSSRRSIVSKRAPPSSLLTRRVTCLSSIAWRRRVGMTSMPCSPWSRRATLSSPKRCSVPGSPSPAPVITVGSVAGARSLPRSPISSRPRSTNSSNRRRSSSPAGAGVGVGAGVAACAARGAAVAPERSAAVSRVAGSEPEPSPAAHRPHSAELNETTPPGLGWFVARLRTLSSPSTSEAKPCSARFGPTSTNTRAPCS